MLASLVIDTPKGAGPIPRLLSFARRLLARRLILRLAGVHSVMVEGRVCILRPVPLGIARDMIPALIRCGRRFNEWNIDESLYDDFVTVLSFGLRLTRANVEALTVPLWELAPIIERIAQINGLPTMEAGRADLGKILATLMTSTGPDSSRGSPATPVGPGTTSSNA